MAEHIARKRFGQHFLCDDDIIHAIVHAIRPQTSDNLVEIGPGLGALTRPLLEALPHFHVVELDRDIVARLEKQYPAKKLRIHAADALEFDFSSLGERLRVVGNLPYNISTPLLFHLAEHAPHLHDIHAMLQKEVVDRMTASPGHGAYGRLSVMLQYHFDMEALFDVPPEAFNPPPKVQSAVVRMIPRPFPDMTVHDHALFSRTVAKAFSQRRKTLRNSLGKLVEDADYRTLGIDPTLRAENLPVEAFIRLSNHLLHASTPISISEPKG